MNNARDIAIALILCTMILLYFGGACDYTFVKNGVHANAYDCYQNLVTSNVYCTGPLSTHKVPPSATVVSIGR